MGWKYKYSLQFQNNEGSWQEHDTFETAEEAASARENLFPRATRIVDLEKERQIG